MVRIDAPTSIGWVIGRTQTNGPADYAAVNEVQDGFVAMPLSVWPAAPSTPSTAPDPTVDMTTAPVDQVLAMSGTELFEHTAELHPSVPPEDQEAPRTCRDSHGGSPSVATGTSVGSECERTWVAL
jgi:hypothetical protein